MDMQIVYIVIEEIIKARTFFRLEFFFESFSLRILIFAKCFCNLSTFVLRINQFSIIKAFKNLLNS